MNIFCDKLGEISDSYFGFTSGSEYIVCVSPYNRTVPSDKNTAYIDGYYEISNSQYHKTREFLAFCKRLGCALEAEREKGYKDFLFENGYFQKGKNTLLQDEKFGSKIYFTVLKVVKMPSSSETFSDVFKSEKEFEEFFIKNGFEKAVIKDIAKTPIRLAFVKFLQVLKSKQTRYKTKGDGCKDCEICLKACPQKALPNGLDNCLRFHMQSGNIELEFSEKLGQRVLGCEICSEVCPKNKVVPVAVGGGYPLEELLEKTEKKDAELCEKYGKNIISKNKLIPYIINAMGNSGEDKYIKVIEKYLSQGKFEKACEIAIAKIKNQKGGSHE